MYRINKLIFLALFGMYVYALATNNLSYVLFTSALFALYVVEYIKRIVKNE